MMLQRMPEAPTAENTVTVAPPDFLDLESPGGLEVGQNTLHRALGDADQSSQVPHPQLRNRYPRPPTHALWLVR